MISENHGKQQGDPVMFLLTIRPTMKNIEEMTFRCPMAWTLSQLKIFIGKNHKHGNDYLRSEKLNLMYQGSMLSDAQTLFDILQNVTTKLLLTFLLCISFPSEILIAESL